MYLSELLEEAGYALLSHMEDIEIRGVCSDSRRVREGEIFVAIKGQRQDGFSHIAKAAARGAVFVVASRETPLLPTLVVENPREAEARLLDAFFGHPTKDMTLIGITGTNGKTSTATMLYEILTAAGKRCGLIGTVFCLAAGEPLTLSPFDKTANMTTPDPAELYPMLADMKKSGIEAVVMEVTSHALYFDKVAPLFFTRAVFTNLTPDHLDLHGDMQHYFAEKRRLFLRAEAGVISLFSPFGQHLADSVSLPLFTVGRGNVRDVLLGGNLGVSFALSTPFGELQISLPVPGDFSVENGALAAMTALSLGVEAEVVRAALAKFTGVRGRMERISGEADGVFVYLDYAHTPDALEKLLRCVRRFREEGQRIILLFGCGGARDRGKRRKMGRIATALADFTVVTSDNCRSENPDSIICEILKGMDKEKPFRIIVDRREAILFALSAARQGDILLLVGKGHEEYEIRGTERLPFSEREIVASYFREKRGEQSCE